MYNRNPVGVWQCLEEFKPTDLFSFPFQRAQAGASDWQTHILPARR